MVSAAVRRPQDRFPLPFEQWTADMRFKLAAAVKTALRGVGVPETDMWDEGGRIMVVRRMATENERAQVPEPYLAPGVSCAKELV